MTEHQTFEFNPASLQELADEQGPSISELEYLRKRNMELVQQQEEFREALEKEIQRNTKLTIGRQEQSRKILELRAEIDTLMAQVKESHEQGYDIICSKDEEITELKKEHAKCQEELKNLKKSMGLLRRKGRFDWEQVPDTLQLRIKMIHDEIREMKKNLATAKTPRFHKNIKEGALRMYLNSRPVKEAVQNGYAYWIAIKELAEECSAAPFDIVQPRPIYKVQSNLGI